MAIAVPMPGQPIGTIKRCPLGWNIAHTGHSPHHEDRTHWPVRRSRHSVEAASVGSTTECFHDMPHAAAGRTLPMWQARCGYGHDYRVEVWVFTRTIAENVNLCMAGHASVFPYEEDFGPMNRVHWLIDRRSRARTPGFSHGGKPFCRIYER
ncbi:DUF6039 family protein [Nonomuraea sp. H19]|uniref:DUF6039 family protein n=1 Tax=Nonomuraea sp. H19 TaxID=3452206 RepID=UPI003F8AD800